MKILLEFFITFAKIGLFTIGGGSAMLPLMQKEIVEKKKWVNEETLLDYFTISQSVPGIIAVNLAILAGYKNRKFPGAFFAALGVVTPSFFIIVIIAASLKMVQGSTILTNTFTAISAAVVALLFTTVLKLGKITIKNLRSVVLALSAFVLVAVFKISPATIIPVTLVIGIIWFIIQTKKAEKK